MSNFLIHSPRSCQNWHTVIYNSKGYWILPSRMQRAELDYPSELTSKRTSPVSCRTSGSSRSFFLLFCTILFTLIPPCNYCTSKLSITSRCYKAILCHPSFSVCGCWEGVWALTPSSVFIIGSPWCRIFAFSMFGWDWDLDGRKLFEINRGKRGDA